jgi:uncharacterized damage-inducible protein DinB
MSIAAAMIPELDQEFTTTLRVLERVPEEQFGWKPHETSPSLQGLAWHTAQMASVIVDMAGLSVIDFDPALIPGPPATNAEIVAEAKTGHGRLRDYLSGLDDAAAMANWTLRIDGKEIMTIPKIVLVRSVGMNHVYHHRGQLSVYLRMLEVPVPSIYGPSGDENPWG